MESGTEMPANDPWVDFECAEAEHIQRGPGVDVGVANVAVEKHLVIGHQIRPLWPANPQLSPGLESEPSGGPVFNGALFKLYSMPVYAY